MVWNRTRRKIKRKGDNWKNIVTNNKGKDGKQSIHDIMIDIT